MTLPPGSTGLRVSEAALPSGVWTWKCKVSRQDVPGIKVATPRELALLSIDIPEGRYPLARNRVDGAKRYVIAGQTRTKTSPDNDRPGASSKRLASPPCVPGGRWRPPSC
jgi:hypothetical protein